MKAVLLRRLGCCAAVLAFGAGCPGISARQSGGNSGSPARAETVVIFPFENAGHEADKDWLAEGLAELTAGRLAGHGPLVYSREERLAVLEKLGLPAYSRFTRATMLKIAAEIDADYVVFGEFDADGPNLRVTARVMGVNPPKLSAPVEESGAIAGLGELEGRAAWRVLCLLKGSLATDAPCAADSPEAQQFFHAGATIQADALEHYVRGLTAADDETRLRELREASRLDPNWDEPIYSIGKTYYSRLDCETALGWFDRVPSGSPHAADAAFSAGVCHLMRNDPLRAESLFAGLAGGSTPQAGGRAEPPEVLNNLGTALLRQARHKEALADFEQAQQADPGEPDYWFNVGLAQYLLGDWGAAARALREALRLQPEGQDARELLLAALDKNGEDEEANALRQEAPEPDPRGARPRQDVTKMNATTLARLARVRRELNAGVIR